MTRTALFSLCLLLFAATAHAQNHTGTLDGSDPVRNEGIPYDTYTFEAASAQKVLLRMESETFDTYLLVKSPSGVETYNDDFGNSSVSQMEFLASEAGTWTVWATAYDANQSGDYTLNINLGGTGRIETMEGRLDPSDKVALKGEYFDTLSFDVESAEQFYVEMVSYGFDGYLVVTSPSGDIWRNDDTDGQTTLSRVGPLQGRGKWRVDATSASSEEVGAYDVKIITLPAE